MRPTVILSCEHGGNRIPKAYAAAFAASDDLLQTHRGFDAGALEMARGLQRSLRAPLFAATVSRLLVDLNRSSHHPALFSVVSRDFDRSTREAILVAHYAPHRAAVEAAIAKALKKRAPVLHLCVHSFTPELHGKIRTCDIGLLYDPKRPGEKLFSRLWQAECKKKRPDLRVRMNYPYSGAADGFTTALRRRLPSNRYLGIELEVNQSFVSAGGSAWARLKKSIEACFATTLSELTEAHFAKKF